MSEEADNVVLRHLRELRTGMDEQFSALRAENAGINGHVADLRGLVLDARAKMATHADVEALGRRLDVDANQVDQRIHELEARVADLERRLGS